jgi:hypothetical protein
MYDWRDFPHVCCFEDDCGQENECVPHCRAGSLAARVTSAVLNRAMRDTPPPIGEAPGIVDDLASTAMIELVCVFGELGMSESLINPAGNAMFRNMLELERYTRWRYETLIKLVSLD